MHTADDRQDALLIEALAEALIAAQLTESRRAVMRERILAATGDSAPPLTETVRGPDIPWQKAWAGVALRVLRRDLDADLQVTVLQMEPGSTVPGHAHTKEEECLVLAGEVLIGSHRLRQGDFHLARAGARHPNITSPSGALLLVRSQVPSFA